MKFNINIPSDANEIIHTLQNHGHSAYVVGGCVRDSIIRYYDEYTANAHRGDYDLSHIVDEKYEESRVIIKDFIGANKKEEIVFT